MMFDVSLVNLKLVNVLVKMEFIHMSSSWYGAIEQSKEEMRIWIQGK